MIQNKVARFYGRLAHGVHVWFSIKLCLKQFCLSSDVLFWHLFLRCEIVEKSLWPNGLLMLITRMSRWILNFIERLIPSDIIPFILFHQCKYPLTCFAINATVNNFWVHLFLKCRIGRISWNKVVLISLMEILIVMMCLHLIISVQLVVQWPLTALLTYLCKQKTCRQRNS